MEKEDLISSGLLELYVLGDTPPIETKMIEEMAALHPDIREEIHQIELIFENLAMSNAIAPDPIVKPFLLATVDFIERMKSGEVFTTPPMLDDNSKAEDYEEWISRPDMILPNEFDEVFAKILHHSQEAITAIAWIKHMAPQEVHDHEYEKFLILEGTCTIHIEDESHHLKPGDYLTIPLHKNHFVEVTSAVPCKVILQRIAA